VTDVADWDISNPSERPRTQGVRASGRRGVGPWPAGVHALLAHLSEAGFDALPEVEVLDASGREVVQYVDGRSAGDPSAGPWPPWVWADDTLGQVARLLRRYHQVVAGFRPADPLAWRCVDASVGPGELVCHNDVSPCSVAWRDGRVVALADWDLAVPAPPEWDLAHAAWQFVPLHHPALASRLGYSPTPETRCAARARRLRTLADEYGLVRREGFLDLVRGRIEVALATTSERAATGGAGDAGEGADPAGAAHSADSGHVRLLRGGGPEDLQRTLAFLDEVGDTLEAAFLED